MNLGEEALSRLSRTPPPPGYSPPASRAPCNTAAPRTSRRWLAENAGGEPLSVRASSTRRRGRVPGLLRHTRPPPRASFRPRRAQRRPRSDPSPPSPAESAELRPPFPAHPETSTCVD
ncbi:putative pollen-specific leucine-rich repeat extensin-like protein 3 [Iris pallida]|uniref:Pollen-specific leucine-rich repeat extensin-like protein 3 n=1 Tax=Iris pallida TaxID=29817 RepID=A0AAX6HL96_IRIPA|nr:putative pollen-specific leucine-rich repeat extensin-like protein 3 [Iris pallida]